jgi:hypothetical protein
MAVYNGFSTRKKESVYNDLTFELMSLLQEEILEHRGRKDEERWAKEYRVVVNRMRKLEKEKFMPPRYSQACEELNVHLKLSTPKPANSPEKDLPILHPTVLSLSSSKLVKKTYN